VPRFGIRDRINFNDCRSKTRCRASANPIGEAATDVLFCVDLRSKGSNALLGNPEIMEEFQADLFSVVRLYPIRGRPVFSVKKDKGCCAGRSLKWNLIMKASGVLITIAKSISILDCGPATQFELQAAEDWPEWNRNAGLQTRAVGQRHGPPQQPRVDSDKRC